MVRAISENQLLDAVTGILVDVGGYRMAWVGYAEAVPGRPVVARAAAGVNQDYLETVRISWADDPRGRGPTGLAIRTGEVCVNRDSRWEPDYEPWRESALRNGFASSIALPLRLDGSVFGALSVYATTPDAFDSEERTLLERFALRRHHLPSRRPGPASVQLAGRRAHQRLHGRGAAGRLHVPVHPPG
jgi:GAF domain-containing protein